LTGDDSRENSPLKKSKGRDKGVTKRNREEDSEDEEYKVFFKSAGPKTKLPTLEGVEVVKDSSGAPRVLMDYEVWTQMREYMRKMDKYVEDQFRFRFKHAQNNRLHRERRAGGSAETEDKQKKPQKGGNKGLGVN
jgi:hypothetical protein